MNTELFSKFDYIDGTTSVVIEDNGRVAYAYILSTNKIVGDVWLYNRVAAPSDPEWKTDAEMPFANSREFVSNLNFVVPNSDREFDVQWTKQNDILYAKIYIRGDLHAVVGQGEKPGRCRIVGKDGPLAKKL